MNNNKTNITARHSSQLTDTDCQFHSIETSLPAPIPNQSIQIHPQRVDVSITSSFLLLLLLLLLRHQSTKWTDRHRHTLKPEAFLLRSFSIKQQRAIIDAVGRPRSRNRSNKRSKSEPTAAAATTTSATTTSATTRILKEMKL